MIKNKEGAIETGRSLNSLIEIGEFCKKNDGFLVITGSYGIALVTKNSTLSHNDLDLQLYFPRSSFTERQLSFLPSSGLIETQIFYFTNCFLTNQGLIMLEGVNIDGYEDKKFQIPLSKVNSQQFRDLGLKIFSEVDDKIGLNFYVKTLPYQIATWIIRLYANPSFQRRKPQERDYQFLHLLLRQQFNCEEVSNWIRRHPQSFNFNESQLKELDNVFEYLRSNIDNPL